MTIRSMPPASAHLADRPVPAPAPMITPPPSSVRAQLRARLVAGHRALHVLVELLRHRVGERGIVDVAVHLDQLDALVEPLAQRGEQRLVGLRVVERLALGVDHRDARERQEQRGGAGRGGELARDPAP